GLGANHCLMRSGRVQHWNTLSRGALSRRVSTRSRSVSWVGRELVIAGLLDWQFHRDDEWRGRLSTCFCRLSSIMLRRRLRLAGEPGGCLLYPPEEDCHDRA